MYSRADEQTSISVRGAQRKETVGLSRLSDLLRDSWQGAPAFLRGIVFLAIALPFAYAQTTSGSISGTVLDQQSAAVPQCPVTALDQDRGSVQRTETDVTGYFVFRSLLPGRYTVTVEAQNFKTFKRRDVVLNANATVALGELQLEVGSVAQAVEVTSQGQEVQTETAQRGDTLISTQILDIQVNGQSPLALLSLMPGIYATGDGVGGAYINGNRFDTQHVMLNGATNMDTGYNNGWMAQISLDAVQEVSVLTSNYQAQYGRAAGGQINIVTKSGASQFHGAGFEYFRDRGLNANSWTNNRVGLPKGGYHYNDAGFNIGGPIFAPHIQHGPEQVVLLLGRTLGAPIDRGQPDSRDHAHRCGAERRLLELDGSERKGREHPGPNHWQAISREQNSVGPVICAGYRTAQDASTAECGRPRAPQLQLHFPSLYIDSSPRRSGEDRLQCQPQVARVWKLRV